MNSNYLNSNYNKGYPVSFKLLLFALYYAPIINFYFPHTNFGTRLPDFGFHEVVLILWICATFIDLLIRKLPRVHTFWIILLGTYSFIVSISLTWSVESYSLANIRNLFYHILVPFLFAYASTYYISNEACRRSLIKHATLGCVILSIIGFVNFFAHYGSNIDDMRSAATLGNPNALAIFLVMNIPLVLYGIQIKVINSKLAYLALICIISGIFCTVSRKGIITAGLSFILFFLITRNYKMLVLSMVIGMSLFIFLVAQPLIEQRFTKEKIDVQFKGKWAMTLAGWDMFLKHPVKGLGYKGYYNEFGHYFKKSGRRKYDAHNNFITAFANYGLIGAVPFLGIFLWPLVKSITAIRHLRAANYKHERLKHVTGIAILIPFMLNAWFAGGLMYINSLVCLLYVLIGMFCIPVPKSR